MAMMKCDECGSEVSTRAKQCPKCGAKVRKNVGLAGVIVVAVFGWFIFSTFSSNTATSSLKSSTALTGSREKDLEPQRSVWRTHVSQDEMTDKHKAYATSTRVGATRRMDFPYANVEAWMGVGCDGSGEWAYFGFSSSPNITNDKTEDGYNVITTRIKWDDTVQRAKLIQEWGAKSIHFVDEASAIKRIAGASSVMLELNWHGQGRVHFQFPLKGSSAAIREMRAKCSS